MESLAEQLKSGSISVVEWESAMRSFVKQELIWAMELAKNGRDNITPSDWGFVGSQAKALYEKLDAFAADIQSNPAKWLNGNSLNARMDLYGQCGYSALENDLAREDEKSGFTEEALILDPTISNDRHCEDCKEEAAKGYVPIGTLSEFGTRQCGNNDRCTERRRKPDGAGGWIYGDE